MGREGREGLERGSNEHQKTGGQDGKERLMDHGPWNGLDQDRREWDGERKNDARRCLAVFFFLHFFVLACFYFSIFPFSHSMPQPW